MQSDLSNVDGDGWHDVLVADGTLHCSTDFAWKRKGDEWWMAEKKLCPLCLRNGFEVVISNRAETCQAHRNTWTKIQQYMAIFIARHPRLGNLDD